MIAPIAVMARKDVLGQTLRTLRDFASRAGHLAGLDGRSIYNLMLAIDEIATNIVEHGYREGDLNAIIVARAQITTRMLIIELEDTGIHYDPTEQEPLENWASPLDIREPGGLGLHLAISSVDGFHYSYVDGCNRNTLEMRLPAQQRQEYVQGGILLYEPDATMRRKQAELLEGYRVETVHEVAEAHRLLLLNRHELLLIGSSAAHADSYHLLKILLLETSPKDVPALIISDDAEYVSHCLELGARDYVHDGFHRSLLTQRIDTLLVSSSTTVRGRIAKLSVHIKNILLADEPELRFGRDMNFQRYLDRFLREIQAMYNADAGTLYLITEDNMLRFVLIRTNSLRIHQGGLSGEDVDFPMIALYDAETGAENHHNVASHVALSGETVNIPDIYANEEYDFSGARWFDERNQYSSVSTLTVPLKDHTNEVIGIVQLINAQEEHGAIVPFDVSQQMIVEALCAYTAVIISNHRLLQKQDKLLILENDLKIGREIQQNFMPGTIPDLQGWDIGARFFPAREVAGDFYDVFEEQGNVVVLIADVCEKGVGAALFMALVRSLLRAFISQAAENLLLLPESERTAATVSLKLQQVVANTNSYILEHHYDLSMFATLFIGILVPGSGRMLYINSGHIPLPLVIRSETGRVESLLPTGPAIGMFEDAEFAVKEMRLAVGDVLVALTDGVIDARNFDGDTLGFEWLIGELSREWQSVGELIGRLESQLMDHIGDAPQFDDMTFWIVRRQDHP